MIKKGGYKGFGLGMMVEILCGILGGSNFGPGIRAWRADVGHKQEEQNLVKISFYNSNLSLF
jgi:LDH2 family malate/lactate/ureidoglycolate dehydrogenase